MHVCKPRSSAVVDRGTKGRFGHSSGHIHTTMKIVLLDRNPEMYSTHRIINIAMRLSLRSIIAMHSKCVYEYIDIINHPALSYYHSSVRKMTEDVQDPLVNFTSCHV